MLGLSTSFRWWYKQRVISELSNGLELLAIRNRYRDRLPDRVRLVLVCFAVCLVVGGFLYRHCRIMQAGNVGEPTRRD